MFNGAGGFPGVDAQDLALTAAPTLMTWGEAWWLLGQAWQRAGQPEQAEAAKAGQTVVNELAIGRDYAETLRRWCREEASRRAGPAALAANDRDRLKLLEREVKELRRANEILRKASAYFAQAELDRQGKW